MKLAAFFAFAGLASASMIQLIGDNSRPGFVQITIDGASYEALDYTGQRGASQGDIWPASVLGYDQLPSTGYYGPRDPQYRYSDYLVRYNEFNDLFDRMTEHPEQAADIQEAIFWISDPANPRYHANVWSDLAAADVAAGLAPDPARFRYIDSPFIPIEHHAYLTWATRAGFIIDPVSDVPEPGTALLAGLGLLALACKFHRN